MNSLDTNILIYASNEDAPEHAKAQKVVAKLLATPGEWILADQVLIEFYRALRNPAVFQSPKCFIRATPKTSKDLVFAPL